MPFHCFIKGTTTGPENRGSGVAEVSRKNGCGKRLPVAGLFIVGSVAKLYCKKSINPLGCEVAIAEVPPVSNSQDTPFW